MNEISCEIRFQTQEGDRMDKFSKILVSVAAASVLASGAMASGLVFYKTGTASTPNTANGLEANASGIRDVNIKDAATDRFGAIGVDDLLKDQTDLNINAYDTSGWPGTNSAKTDRMLAYYSSSELPKDATLKFTIACGQLLKPTTGDVFLYALDTNSSGDTAWIRVGHMTDFTTVANGSNTGYTMLKFAVDSGHGLCQWRLLKNPYVIKKRV